MKTIKNSKQRETILKILRSVKSHPNADWIYSETRKEIPNISLGTVYRNLSRLAQEGHILKFDVGEGFGHFDGNPNPHYHLYCKNCKRVSDLDMGYIKELDSIAQGTSKCEIDGHSLIFFGICKDCKRS